LNHDISAGIFRAHTKGFGKTAEQNDGLLTATFAKVSDQLQTIHRGHAIVCDDQVGIAFFMKMQGIDATTGGDNLIPQFFQDGAPGENAVAVIVYQKNEGT
jgi:hypothetical protein